ncbi:response regulator [Dactylosporangium fulvum]|uniref:Response regulator n=2 Tax=Dactylosporangium fulvum TaxID=53359 RepID=A0ABY5WBT9_9ACTN|nr:response regulator [Dactylosporangium fulvum]
MADEVAEAADVRSALAIAARERPDVVFLDLRMPGGDGTGFLAATAGDPDLSAVPVVVVTAADPADFTGLDRAAAVLAKEQLSRRAVAEVLTRIVR